EHKVAAAGMTRLKTKDDPPVIGGPGGIVLGGHWLPVLIQMAIGVRGNLVVDGDDRAVDVVAAVGEGPVASGIGEVTGTKEVGVFAGQTLADDQRIGKAVGHVGYTERERCTAVKQSPQLPLARGTVSIERTGDISPISQTTILRIAVLLEGG